MTSDDKDDETTGDGTGGSATDALAAAYVGLWRDYMSSLSAGQAQAALDPELMKAGMAAWQQALSTYGQSFTPNTGSAAFSPGAASAAASHHDRDDALRAVLQRLDDIDARLKALEEKS